MYVLPIVGEKVYKLEAFRLLVFELKKYFAVTRRELGIYIYVYCSTSVIWSVNLASYEIKISTKHRLILSSFHSPSDDDRRP